MTTNPELERWNERFSSDDYLFGTAPNAFLVSQSHLLRPGQRVLAIADGEGRNGVWLAEQGLEVLSIDFSPVALEKAHRLAASRNVMLRTQQADMEIWNWAPEQFEIVVAVFIQFARPDLRAAIFQGIKRTLTPGGLLILQGYRPEQLGYGTGGPPHAENMYTADMLRSAFADFDILHLQEHDSPLSEGQGHHGMSALVDCVARKRSL
ncbi:class I SAM-dependent methyltransferase [Indioceanicola profundi]|uniref:class I SAM-dependent methyltransferase n=1 Tax=Indioceanicola profundi TaxID=2220096 RepID=UPI000E6ABEB4|nr:class I SAM-dependent methyltransferase [Indioceanicola profundi]